MFRTQFISKTQKRIALVIVTALMITGFALAPNSVAVACGTGTSSCACPGC